MSAQVLVCPQTPPELIAALSLKGLMARLERLGFDHIVQIRFRRQPSEEWLMACRSDHICSTASASAYRSCRKNNWAK